jgi:hypothetical protein
LLENLAAAIVEELEKNQIRNWHWHGVQQQKMIKALKSWPFKLAVKLTNKIQVIECISVYLRRAKLDN